MIIADVVSGGWVFGIAIALVIGAICIGVAALAWSQEETGIFWGAVVCGLLTLVVFLIASWPLKYDYHHWVDKRGKVTKIGSRFISAGDNGGTNQRFVFVLNGQAYGVDDTRASLARVGDAVHIRCKKEHQFFQNYSDDGWACRWMNDSQVTGS